MPAGIMVINVEAENNSYQTPSTNQLANYANQYGVINPMFADPGWGLCDQLEQDGYIPTFALVAYDGTILAKDDVNAVNNQLNNAAPPYGGP